MLAEVGVRYLGFPLRLAVHQEDLSEEDAARIIVGLDASCYGVLITYLDRARDIIALCEVLGARMVQLHGDVPVAEFLTLKKQEPDLTVIKSLVVGRESVQALERTMMELSPHVDAFIADTYDPVTGASGATGKTHDWAISRRLVETSERPVILAGGLNPDNVRGAIQEVHPAGVDVHTGVEDDAGRKCPRKVTAFVAEARGGFAELPKGAA